MDTPIKGHLPPAGGSLTSTAPTHLGQTHCYFALTVHSLDLEVDTANWNLHRPNRTVWVEEPVDLLTYEADRSGEQVHAHYVITQEVEVDTADQKLCGSTGCAIFYSIFILPELLTN